MQVFWHSFLNVAIVIVSIFAATYSFYIDRPIRDGITFLSIGLISYALLIYDLVNDGGCELINDDFISRLLSLNECIDPYSMLSLVGQFALLSAALIGLGLCWRPVMRKLEKEQGDDS